MCVVCLVFLDRYSLQLGCSCAKRHGWADYTVLRVLFVLVLP